MSERRTCSFPTPAVLWSCPSSVRQGQPPRSTALARAGVPWKTACSELFSVFPGRELGELCPGPGAGAGCGRIPAPRPRLPRGPHGRPRALEAAGVLRAAAEPGDAGREDPRRGYQYLVKPGTKRSPGSPWELNRKCPSSHFVSSALQTLIFSNSSYFCV